jgi:succinate-acetate transporter protein
MSTDTHLSRAARFVFVALVLAAALLALGADAGRAALLAVASSAGGVVLRCWLDDRQARTDK